ncbi:MAG: hypothetical protein HY744_32590 [Deltaproteobacteria bacterium]|nr:hypothetical protein [Deltaproteobacteria bacterium]
MRALDPDNMLVTGARGTGKSLWWHALQSKLTQPFIAQLFSPGAPYKLEVSAGWGDRLDSGYPGKDVLASLLEFPARIVWKTVVLSQLDAGFFRGDSSWRERVIRVRGDPDGTERRLLSIDEQLESRNAKRLVLFDALDKAADRWSDLRTLLKGLLQLLLELRMTRAIRAKAFVRTDTIEDPEIKAFPDAAKLLYARVELLWPRTDLYGLLWQYLGNAASEGGAIRSATPGWRKQRAVWEMPEALYADESVQRKLFALVAGTQMGRDRRRRIPYAWVPNHLGDARGQATPRSFLAALRAAAQESAEDAPHALHWEAIKKGVQRASSIRVDELKEDFPWTAAAMKPLEHLVVPCDHKEILDRWRKARVLESIRTSLGERLPRRYDQELSGIFEDLQEIGVLQSTTDGRVNVPDVYRVAFRLKRKGGVKPVR